MIDLRLRVRDYDGGLCMAPHAHPDATLSIVVRGDFLERIGRGERGYQRGSVAYLPAGRVHAQAFGSSGARQVTFEPPPAWIDCLAADGVALDQAPHAGSATFGRLGDRILREVGAPDAVSALACQGALAEVVASFGRDHGVSATGCRAPAWLRAARDFMHDNVVVPLSLAAVARAAGRHEIHLAREFRRYFGSSVAGYQRRLRAERAADLLLRSDAGVGDIALECGFSSHAHLCRVFRLHYGVAPSEFRRGASPECPSAAPSRQFQPAPRRRFAGPARP